MANDPTKLVFDDLPAPSPGTVRLTFGDDSPEPPAHGVRLAFGQPAATSPGVVRLVFGGEDDGPAPSVPDATLHGTGRITGLRLHITVRAGLQLVGSGRITGMRLRVVAAYKINAARPTVARTNAVWQVADPRQSGLQDRAQDTIAAPSGAAQHWQPAIRTPSGAAVIVQNTLRAPIDNRSAYNSATRAMQDARTLYSNARRDVRRLLREAFANAQRGQTQPLTLRHQDNLRDRRPWSNTGWQGAQRQGLPHISGQGPALWLNKPFDGDYQNAMRPPPGIYAPTPVVPPPDPCYLPTLPVRLVFGEPADSSLPARLVFVCERHGPGPQPETPQFVIPLLRVYMTVHSISAVLLPSLERVQLSGVSISSNDDGFGWSLSAAGPEHLIDQLALVGGLPARIRVTIDGIDWVFAVDPPDRTRKFAERKVSVVGQSVTALLGAPYLPSSDWDNSGAAFTAQQLVAKALEFTGVGIDWGITDWLVPAGAWSFQGTPLAVAQRVAEAVGAVVRSHRTEEILQFAPRYPAMPWEWDAAPLDVQMPGQIMTSDSLQNRRNPDWEAVYVLGQIHGQKGHVVRTGTAGSVLAPQVIDSLITHPDAARQRGRAVLGAAGRGYTQSMTVPLLTGGSNPGLILPGYLLQVDEPGESWRGLVRGITINESAPTVRQQLVVERKA